MAENIRKAVKKSNAHVLCVNGDAGNSEFVALKDELATALSKPGLSNLAIDVSSAGPLTIELAQLLLAASRSADALGKSFEFKGLSSDLQSQLDLAGISLTG